jgi:hypothetical protein
LRTIVNQKLIECGEKENLKEFLRSKLSESGWRDSLKSYCREVVKKNPQSTMEDLVAEIIPYARSKHHI